MMGFQQAQYKYICSRADRGFQYDYADEEKSHESDGYWFLKDYKNRLMATVVKKTGEVHEALMPKRAFEEYEYTK